MTTQQALHELELTKPVGLDELKRAYRQAIQVWHPDRFEYNPDLQGKAISKTKQINDAYSLLHEKLKQGWEFDFESSEPKVASPMPEPAVRKRDPAESSGKQPAQWGCISLAIGYILAALTAGFGVWYMLQYDSINEVTGGVAFVCVILASVILKTAYRLSR